ncbi:MAG: hypothetical protein DI539_15975 [Flavobacterium psychrophilum]|nr:MAG: hypothetical protein DI539_15975 [Flavobacterium psychrophilum]
MTTKTKKKKEFDITTWTYKERKHTINIHASNPSLILFEMGYHQSVDPNTWSKVILSRVQKQLKQYLYNYLSASNYPTDSYILVLDGGSKATKGQTFVDMKVALPMIGDMEANKVFCDTLTEKMYSMMDKMIKLV